MGILLTNDFNKNLAEYFARKYLYPDLTDHGKPDNELPRSRADEVSKQRQLLVMYPFIFFFSSL